MGQAVSIHFLQGHHRQRKLDPGAGSRGDEAIDGVKGEVRESAISRPAHTVILPSNSSVERECVAVIRNQWHPTRLWWRGTV